MKLTIIQVGQTPAAMSEQFGRFPPQFQDMFAATGEEFSFETAFIVEGEAFPDPSQLEGVIIPGSAKGVYDDVFWMQPLRAFIQKIYALKIPMLGVCFGHQIMADALGGEVQKSEKGLSYGRHTYAVRGDPQFMNGEKFLALAASHQDQVIVAPEIAKVFLSSEFTPNAGLMYDNGAAISIQPHPEFALDYSRALARVWLGRPLTQDQADAAELTFQTDVDNHTMAKSLARFFKNLEQK